MLLNLTNYSSEPIHNQIVQQILLRILNEDKFPGDELESISKISRQHHISKASIKKAFERLEILGVINSSAEGQYIISDISNKQLKKIIERDFYSSLYSSEYDLFTAELEAAKQIQNEMLPKHLPNNNYIEAASYSTISEEVGGDFYDFFEIEKNKYGFVIGDACGKGLAAAMLISQIQAIIKSDLSLNHSLPQTILLLNSYLYTHSSARHFASLFYGIMDFVSNKLTYINAGHNFPIILNKTYVQRLKTTGPALGIMPNPTFAEEVKKINVGDLIFLFTDGLIERMNSDNVQFGEHRLKEILINQFNRNSNEIISEIKNKIKNFSSNIEELDDTTFMLIKIKELRTVN